MEKQPEILTLTTPEFYEILPENYRLARGADFHTKGILKIGMKYLVMGAFWEVYQCHTVNERLTGARLKEFLKDGRVFVENNPIIN